MKRYIEPQIRLSRFENESVVTEPSGGYDSYSSWESEKGADTKKLSLTNDFKPITGLMNE